mgnify:FL=1
MARMNTLADPAPTTLDLWRTLRVYIEQACALFGLPVALAQKIWLSRIEHKRIGDLLAALEALLRRLLFIDALGLAPIFASAESKARVRRGMGAACGAHFNLDDSESWRVAFQLGAYAARPRAGKPRRTTAPPLINACAAAPLAERLEALIRAYNNREAMAQRLADRLVRAPTLRPALLAVPRTREAARPIHRDIAHAAQLAQHYARAKTHALDSS